MQQLSDLPNIGKELEKMLIAAGIETPEELTQTGSVQALIKIGAQNHVACANKLFALEGAIQGVRWHSLSKETKEELKKELEAAISN